MSSTFVVCPSHVQRYGGHWRRRQVCSRFSPLVSSSWARQMASIAASQSLPRLIVRHTSVFAVHTAPRSHDDRLFEADCNHVEGEATCIRCDADRLVSICCDQCKFEKPQAQRSFYTKGRSSAYELEISVLACPKYLEDSYSE